MAVLGGGPLGPTRDMLDAPAAKSRKTGSALGKLDSFKDKLKASNLADDAAQAEKKHKDELAAEKEKALAKYRVSATEPAAGGSAGSSASAANCPDNDERLSFSDIWKEGEEESTSDWLSGSGLKFHTTADKAFSMDSKR